MPNFWHIDIITYKYEKKVSMVRLKCLKTLSYINDIAEIVYSTDGQDLYEEWGSSSITKIVPGNRFGSNDVISITKKSGENTFIVKSSFYKKGNKNYRVEESYINFPKERVIMDNEELDCYRLR